MQQTVELARVKARIRALADRTVSNGCTEAEAFAAAEMVGRLLDRYCLSMAEIDMRQAACIELPVFSGARRRQPIDGCVPAIARFCDCKVWLTRAESGVSYVFFGFEPDALLARYLFQVIEAAIATEKAAFRHRNPQLRDAGLRRSAASFQHGMAARLAERLEAMLAARADAVAVQRAAAERAAAGSGASKGARSDGRALAVVKQTVVDAAFRESGTRLQASRPASLRVVHGAFRDGLAAGERVNLNRPLTGSAPARLE